MRVKKVLKWVAITMISSIMLVLLTLSLLLNTSWGAGIVSQQVSKLVPGKLSWNAIFFNPFGLVVQVKDFKTIALDNTTEVISVGSVRLDISASALLSGKLRVTNLALQDVSVLIAFDSLGNLSLAQAFARPDSIPKVKKPFDAEKFLNKGIIPLRVDTFTIANANVRYVDKRFDMDISIEKSTLSGACNLKKLTASLLIETPKVHVGIPAFTSYYDTLSLQVVGSPRHVSKLGIYFANADDTVRITGNGNDFLFVNKTTVDLSLDATADIEKLFSSLRLEIGGKGRAQVKAHIQDRIADPSLALSAVYIGEDMAHTALRRAYIALNHKQRAGNIDSLFVVDSFGTKVRLEGNYSIVPLFPVDFFHTYQAEGLKSLSYDATIKILDARYPLTPDLLLSQGSGTIIAKGVGVLPEYMNAAIDLSTDGLLALRRQSPTQASVSSTIVIDGWDYTYKNLLIGCNQVPLLTGDGTLNPSKQTIQSTFAFDTLSLSPLMKLFSIPLAGEVSGTLDAGGSLKAPSLKVALKGRQMVYDEIAIDSLSVTLATTSGAGKVVGDVALYQAGGTLQTAVDGTLFKPHSFTVLTAPHGLVRATVDAYPIQSILPDYAGLLNVDLTYQGALGKGTGSCFLFVDTLKTPWFQGRVEGDVGIEDSLLLLRDLQLAFSPEQILRAQGELDYAQRFKLSLSSDPLHLTAFSPINSTGVMGLATLQAQLSGTLSEPQGSLNLQMDSLKMSDFSFDKSFTLQAELTPTDVTATIKGDINLLAQYKLEEGSYSADVRLEKYDISGALQHFVAPRLKGTVSLSSSLEGGKKGISKLTLGVPLLQIFEDSTEVLSVDTLGVRYADESLLIDSCRLVLLKEGSFVLSGRTLLEKELEYDIEAQGDIPLKLIDYFTDAVGETSGKFLCDVTLKGPMSQPQMAGTFHVRDGNSRIVSLNQQLQQLQGTLILQGNRFTIDSFSTSLDAGTIAMHGGGLVGAKGVDSAALSLDLHKVNLQLPGEGELTLNGKITYTGSEKSPHKLFGEIELLDGLYYKNINLLPDLSKGAMNSGSVNSLRTQSANKFEVKNSLGLSIKLIPRGALVVDNNMAYMEVVPDLMLIGSVDKPLLEGRATVENGEVSYLSTLFTIDRGIIDFSDPYKISSHITIDASSQIDKYLVKLTIEGDPEKDLRFTMSSTPSLKDEDIISLIVFGVVGQDIGGNSNESTALIITQLANKALENSGVPIDKLAVEMDNNSGYLIQMGLDLSEKLSAEISMDTRENESVQRTDLRYMIIENLLLRGYITTKGESGVDVGVKFEKR